MQPVLSLWTARTSSNVGNRRPSVCIDARNELVTDALKAGVFVLLFMNLERPYANKPVRSIIVTDY